MENLYVVCSKVDFDSKYKDWSSGGENYSLDNTKVQFSNRFTGQQIKDLVQDSNVEIYNSREINTILDSAEWKESAPLIVVIDQKFKDDYTLSTNKLDFLTTKLGLK